MVTDESIERHYAALRQVLADPDMNTKGPYATITQSAYFDQSGARPRETSERRALHRQWIAEVLDKSSERGEIKHEGKAIVMAGPPGAGKGTVQRERLNDVPGYVQCDPDMFKEKIIQHELDSGNLDRLKTPLVRELESEGHKFAPMEFAALVHEESSMLSAKLQKELRKDGTNYVIDTVLKSQGSAQEVAATLDKRGYTYDVVSVQASFEESKAGIYGRWQEGRAAFERGDSALGGRPVPSDFANNLVTPEGKSATELSAKWLAENGKGVQSYTQYRRGLDMPEIDQVKVDGKLVARNSGQTSPSKSSEPSKPVAPRNRVSGINADFPHAAGRKQQRSAEQKPYDSGRNTPSKDRGIER